MARDLKVWSYALCRSNSDEGLTGAQIRAVVATTTKKAAADAFGVSMSEFNNYAGETSNERQVKMALSKPGQVFASNLDDWGRGKIVEITRKPHVVFSRRKRSPTPAFTQPPLFSIEELRYMQDMFADANNPIALDIANKALAMIKYRTGE